MTHAELVRSTADKMAKMFNEQTKRLGEGRRVEQFLPLAELAVAMKAEGFDDGADAVSSHTTTGYGTNWDLVKHEKQSLGLTKPKENGTIS